VTDRGAGQDDASSDLEGRDPFDPGTSGLSDDAGAGRELDEGRPTDEEGGEGDLEGDLEDDGWIEDADDDLVEAEMVETVGPEVDEPVPAGAGGLAAAGAATTTLRPARGEGRTRLEVDDPVSKWWVALIVVVFIAIFAWALLFGQGGFLSGLIPAASPSPSPSLPPTASPTLEASPSASASSSPSPSVTLTPMPSATATPTPRPTTKPTPTPTPRVPATPTPPPTPTPIPTPTPTAVPTPRSTAAATATSSPIPTVSPSTSVSPSLSPGLPSSSVPAPSALPGP
jgi:hypothetical protein